MAFWVYILECADGSFYVGHTDNLEARVGQHHRGTVPSCYTINRRSLRLVHSQLFATRYEALSAERQIKGWSRAKKIALIAGDWAEISRLARLKRARPQPPFVRCPRQTPSIAQGEALRSYVSSARILLSNKK
ncbi:MAG TPA: GIY-YIG nuclease family protein [Steroidobacteraceae bacterium]|jgi:predicted GIY-YIG superfamily endonuclease